MTSRTAGKAFTARPQLSPFVGIGLRSSHIEEVLTRRPDVGWFEIHAENYMRNPAALRLLEQVRMRYPLSLHGVALSLGSAGPLDRDHLAGLKELVDRLDPFLVSEHMAWSSVGGDYLNDLLPLPCTEEALETMISHVAEVQHTLDRRILVENPSGYLRFEHSTMGEANFLAELVRRTGCGLLCDVNNIYVSASNLGFDVDEYMMVLPVSAVGEIHLAGHSANILGNTRILIDDHASCVSLAVWKLFDEAVCRFGSVPTLVEWDNDLPPLDILLGEAGKAAAAIRSAVGHALAS
ncbi:MAG TPA: DUF692 domain-containing protein [Acetobacteraceae bacterium]|nr:DUF692 domain-containing protein [Acetobacteraceae bacterium]